MQPSSRTLLAAILLFAVHAYAQAGGQTQPVVPGFTSNPIKNPVLVNIFWDANWDTDNPGMSRGAINNFTSALVQSSYFSSIMSDYGVQSVTFGGAFQADNICGGIDVVNPTAPVGTVGLASLLPTDVTVNTFIYCEAAVLAPLLAPNGPNVIYNIFFPPATQVTNFWFPVCPLATGLHFHGMSPAALAAADLLGWETGPIPLGLGVITVLAATQGPPFYTIIPTSAACLSNTSNGGFGGFSALTATLTHEIVEAITDPNPPLSVLTQKTLEIADTCEVGSPGVTPFLTLFNSGPPSGLLLPSGVLLPFGGQTSTYFSTSANGCVPTPAVPPVISSITFTVPPVGSPMSGLGISVSGTGFGALPTQTLDFVGNSPVFMTPSSNGQSGEFIVLPATNIDIPYFSFADGSTTPPWKAGNAIDQDGVLLDYANWSGSLIQINGFGGQFGTNGMTVAVGHSVTVTVCNPNSGACATTGPTTVPAPVTAALVSPKSGPASGGTSVTITGTGFEPGTAPQVFFDGQSVSGTALTSTSLEATTPAGIPGTVQVQVQNPDMTNPSSGGPFFSYCAPSVTSVTPSKGPTSGGTPVTITGTCLAGVSFASFGAATLWEGSGLNFDPSTGNIVIPKTPPSCPGTFDVRIWSPDFNSKTESPQSSADQFTYTAFSPPDSSIKIPPCTLFTRTPPLCSIAPAACRPYIPFKSTLVAIPSVPPVVTFGDLSGFRQMAAAIEWVASTGIMPGVSTDKFGPSGGVTRAEFSVYLERMLGLSQSAPLAFSDVDRGGESGSALAALSPYFDFYINSKGAPAFRPELPLDRMTAAVVGANLLVAAGKSSLMTGKQADHVGSHLRDWGKIDATTRPEIEIAIKAGLIASDWLRFNPSGTLNRAQTALLLSKLRTALVATPQPYDDRR
jgi:hypothetical protein